MTMTAEQWRRVKDIFHDALDRPASERSAFVAAQSDGDADVRAEVERLLAAESQSAGFIEPPPAASAFTGKRFGRYDIGRLLGVGGMGEVYEARDVDLGRTVAIKFATASDPDAQSRLKREAQHASRLNHPHICTIYEVGTADGRPFIAMEYVAGRRLADVIPDGGLPAGQVIDYATQIADALAYAHQQHVVHRDLKTANIGITPEGRAKVLDFGLARRLRPNQLKEFSQSQTTRSSDTPLAGTLSCMAPEVLRGEPDDERSDIWGLGVLLYEMASGARPFNGATPFQLSGAILHEPPAPLPRTVPSAIRAIIERCLEKDPLERYQHAAEVRDALHAQPAKAIKKKKSKSQRWGFRRWLVYGVIFIAVANFLDERCGRSTDTPITSPSGRSIIAVMPFDTSAATDDQLSWLSAGVPSMLTTGLVQTQGLDVVGTSSLQDAVTQLGFPDLTKLNKSQAADVARRTGAGTIVLGSVFRAGTEIRIDAQLEDLATGKVLVARSVRGSDVFALIDQLTEQIRTAAGAENTFDIRGVADVSSRSLEAYRLYSEGLIAFQGVRLDEAHRLLEAAVRIDPEFAEAYLALAGVDQLDPRPKERSEYLALATRNADRLGEREKLLLQVEAARDEGDAREAATSLDELLAKFPNYHAAYPVALWLYSPIVGIVQDTKKSVAIQAGGARVMPSSSEVHLDYAYALIDDGQFGAAIEELEKAATLAPREPNPSDSLGEAHLAAGMAQKAAEFYTRALTIDPTFRPSNLGRSIAFAILGRYDDALAERNPDSKTEAFMLSRVGRYRDAERVLGTGLLEAGARGNILMQANVNLLAALLHLEREQYTVAIGQVDAAIKTLSTLPAARQRGLLLLAHALGGLTQARAGRVPLAEEHQALFQKEMGDERVERLWASALAGEIAIAQKQWDQAATIFTASKNLKPWLALGFENPWMFVPNLPSRDGLARAAVGRGDLATAIDIYRRFTRNGGEEGSSSVLEPRHVLQLARLLDRSGDKAAARREYQRFLELWKNADADLPELAEAKRAVAR